MNHRSFIGMIFATIICFTTQAQAGPLHFATMNGNIDDVKHLVETGANVNEKGKNGFTPLHMAAFRGFEDIARFLISHGADVNIKGKDGITPLAIAIQTQHQEIADILKRAGAKE